jgi:hypothetical protein
MLHIRTQNLAELIVKFLHGIQHFPDVFKVGASGMKCRAQENRNVTEFRRGADCVMRSTSILRRHFISKHGRHGASFAVGNFKFVFFIYKIKVSY